MDIDANVLIPICHLGSEWDPELVSRFLDDESVQSVVCTRCYDVVGYSRGGTGGYRVAAHLGERARTLTAISARPAAEVISRLQSVPILIVHGSSDQVVPLNDIRELHAAIRKQNAACTLVELDGDHFIAEKVFTSGLITEWQSAA